MKQDIFSENDAIVAVSTPPGTGGIAVVRLSGRPALEIFARVWKGKDLGSAMSHSAHFGRIINESGEVLDEAVATVFRAPHSFTGEDTVEISCHGSRWIQREIVNLLIRCGARGAEPGEFSKRAFMNGRIDLAQAEGIIDLISSGSRAAHRLAMMQANGAFSGRLEELRGKLIDFASLLELELDFSEEDVEFADRERLRALADEIIGETGRLADSYAAGRVFKEGIPVVIAGRPNSGKSTLLNALLEDEKAIVSEIPGTTRDIIEDTREIGGNLFRFVDTAGLRATDDVVERIGIERANDRIRRASAVLWMVDTTSDIEEQLRLVREQMASLAEDSESSPSHIILYNKVDLSGYEVADSEEGRKTESMKSDALAEIRLSAKRGEGIEELKEALREMAEEIGGDADIMVTNARHYESLEKGREALQRARAQLDAGISADFIAQDVREALHHLGAITGAITTPTLLQTIFARFCIGK